MSNRRLGARRLPTIAIRPLIEKLKKAATLRRSKVNRRTRPAPAQPLTATRADTDAQAAPPAVRPLARLGLWLLPLGVLAVFAAVPSLVARTYTHVLSSDYFHVREVLVDISVGRVAQQLRPGDRMPEPHLTREEVTELAGVGPGTHLLQADLDALRARLLSSPWIRWAELTRELPDRLIIRVLERAPAAYLAAGDLYLVDDVGFPFLMAPPGFTARLPVISGGDVLTPERVSDPAARPAVEAALQRALNILRKWDAQGLATRYPIGELRLDAGDRVSLVLEKGDAPTATEIALGEEPYADKLLQIEWILEHLRSLNQSAEYILLEPNDPRGEGSLLGGARVVVKPHGPADLLAATAPDPAPAATPPQRAPRAPFRRPARAPAPPTPSTPNPQDSDETPEAIPLTGGEPAGVPGDNALESEEN